MGGWGYPTMSGVAMGAACHSFAGISGSYQMQHAHNYNLPAIGDFSIDPNTGAGQTGNHRTDLWTNSVPVGNTLYAGNLYHTGGTMPYAAHATANRTIHGVALAPSAAGMVMPGYSQPQSGNGMFLPQFYYTGVGMVPETGGVGIGGTGMGGTGIGGTGIGGAGIGGTGIGGAGGYSSAAPSPFVPRRSALPLASQQATGEKEES